MSERCYPADVWHFVGTSPYLALAKPHSALRYLRANVEAAEECTGAL